MSGNGDDTDFDASDFDESGSDQSGAPEFQGGAWLRGSGPDSDIAICTRVRLARNLVGYHFSPQLAEEQARQLRDFVIDRLQKPGLPEQLAIVDLDSIDELERSVLVERHLISRELATSRRPRAAAIDSDESVAIMVNEEDHLRMQVFESGLELDGAWRRAERLDDALMQRLPIAWSEEFGFQTSCPTNTGTGLRLSVMLHLPGLVWSEDIERATNVAQKIHLAVRGLYGEGSRALGDFYQVSNQITLGRDEEQIIDDVRLAVGRIVTWEREVREALLRGAARARTLDRIHRALGTIERAQILTSEESLGCLSALRLGLEEKVLSGFTVADVNRALLLSQPGHLQRESRQRLDPDERDERRARLVREVLRVQL
ncbi:MAG: protein arginine kinase [bacterium]|nr:protein arginine kinase [bacterium]